MSPAGPLGPRGPLGPLGPLGPVGPVGALGLGPFAEQPLERIEERAYRQTLSGSAYVLGTVRAGEEETVWAEGAGFEDVYEIRLQRADTLTLVVTQSRPGPGFDVILLDEDEAVVARSWDAPGGVKYLQADLSAGNYRVGVSYEDGETILASADREYALSVVVY